MPRCVTSADVWAPPPAELQLPRVRRRGFRPIRGRSTAELSFRWCHFRVYQRHGPGLGLLWVAGVAEGLLVLVSLDAARRPSRTLWGI